MNLTADKVYEGYYLFGTIIEPAYEMSSIHTIIEDKQGKVIKICFYGLESQVVIGQTVIITNPYIRQSLSREVIIRVDDPKSVIFQELNDICRACTRTRNEIGKLLKCTKCGAKYCSEECQRIDWTSYAHKLLCGNK